MANKLSKEILKSVREGTVKKTRQLLENYPGLITTQGKYGRTLMMIAAINDDPETLSVLHEHGGKDLLEDTDKEEEKLLLSVARFIFFILIRPIRG